MPLLLQVFVLPDRSDVHHERGLDVGTNIALGVGLGIDMHAIKQAQAAATASGKGMSNIAAALGAVALGSSPAH